MVIQMKRAEVPLSVVLLCLHNCLPIKVLWSLDLHYLPGTREYE